MKQTIISALLLSTLSFFALAFSPAVADDNPKMDWLIGDWYIPEMGSFEKWEKDGKDFVGTGYKISGSDTTVWETIRVSKENKGWVMAIQVREEETVEYLLTSHKEGLLVFQNPTHDFPQRIEYAKGKGGAPVVTLVGSAEMDLVREVLTFEKAMGQRPLPDLPRQAMLGERGMIAYGVSDLEASAAFYELLGFKRAGSGTSPNPWVRLSDGAVLIMLQEAAETWCAMSYVSGDADMRKDAMANAGLNLAKEDTKDKALQGTLKDPDQVMRIAIFKGNSDNYPRLPVMAEGALGKFGEIAIPVSDLKASSAFYQRMGFKELSKKDSPYNWGVYSDGIMLIGLHETASFDKPALTYFSQNAADRIEALQRAGLEVTGTMPETKGERMANGTVLSPDGWPVNVFYGAL